MKSIFQRSFVLLSLVAAGTVPVFAGDTQNVVINLPSSYTVPQADQKTIRLGDLAISIQAPDTETQKRFESLPVLEAPAPGESTRLPNHYIIQSIRKAGLNFANVHFTGERLVEILGHGRTLDIQTILQKMKNTILEESGWKEDELVLRVLSVPTQELWVPPKKIEIVLHRTSPILYGTVRYEVQLFMDSVLYKSFPIIASIAHRRSVFMPNRPLQRGDVIGPDDIREVVQYFRQELSDRQAVGDIKEIVGSKCRTPLTQSDIIQWNNLDVNYVVNQGDRVKLIVQSDGMSMQTVGKALKRGAIGDIVPVKTEPSNFVVKARILQRGLVELISS